jgi:hypothetical protein
MALIAATIGNDGVLLRPHLIQSIEDERSAVLVDYAPEPFTPTGRSDAQVISVQTATTLREMMVGVVANGTGGRAAIPGVTVAGKTGTAEPRPSGSWGSPPPRTRRSPWPSSSRRAAASATRPPAGRLPRPWPARSWRRHSPQDLSVEHADPTTPSEDEHAWMRRRRWAATAAWSATATSCAA